eukprot:5959701-Amphidinium_carterae.1
MNWEIKKCADPRLGDFPAFEPICMDDRLSVRHIGQDVHIGHKDPKSRSLTSVELVSLCEVMLAFVDPSNYTLVVLRGCRRRPVRLRNAAASGMHRSWMRSRSRQRSSIPKLCHPMTKIIPT